MFTWICPKCGKEVQPSDDECPYCREAGVTSEAAQSSTPEPPAPKPRAETPPPPVEPAAPKKPAAAAKPASAGQKPSAQQTGGMVAMPGWVVALIVAVGLIGVGALIYSLTTGDGREPAAAPSAPSMSESPFEPIPEAAEEEADSGSMARYIEAAGIRVNEAANGRLEVRFLIINHSGSDIGDLAGTVHVRSRDGETNYTSVDFHTSGLAAYESIEFTVVRSSNILAEDVPEWWNLRGDVEITFPSNF